jgi:hypothetical protein
MGELNTSSPQPAKRCTKPPKALRPTAMPNGQPGGSATSDQEVTDVDFEEVKEK